MSDSTSYKPAVRSDRDRVRGWGALGAFVKTILSFVLFFLCTTGVGDFCFPIHKRCPDSPWLCCLAVAVHVLAGVALVEGMRALWGRAVARFFCAAGFVWFLLALAMVSVEAEPKARGLFIVIFGLLALYYLVRFILLCRRPAPR